MKARLHWALAAFALVLTVHRTARAEEQARTEEEYDAYLRVERSQEAASIVVAARSFEQNWPASGLLLRVLTLRMEACRSLADRICVIEAGRRALALSPNDIPVLAGLAQILPNGSQEPEEWQEAEQHARQVLKLLDQFHPPRTVSPAQWETMRLRLASRAHEALGMVAFKRGKVDEAVREFELAVSGSGKPDAGALFRLGKLYQLQKRMPEARQAFERIVAQGDPVMAERARLELRATR